MPRLGRARPHSPLIVKQDRRPTRLYLPSSGAAAVSPAFDAGWEDVASASPARRPLKAVPSATAMTTVSFTDLDATDRDVLMYQGVSLPLSGAQTIVAQNVQLAVLGSEVLLSGDEFIAWTVKVFSKDGGTLRGTLVSMGRDDVELATALTCRNVAGAGGAVSALDGDRIVLEVGVGGDPLVAHDSSIRVGDAAASDLPYDDVTTTDSNPFVQFSQALVFGLETAAGPPKNTLLLVGVGI